MVNKILALIFIFVNLTYASEDTSSFKTNCLSCHTNYFKFNMMMKKYTEKFSSERAIKKAMFEYLKEPSYKKSVLPFGYLNRFGIKDASFLNDKELKDMIDIYYKEFNIKSKIY